MRQAPAFASAPDGFDGGRSPEVGMLLLQPAAISATATTAKGRERTRRNVLMTVAPGRAALR